MKIASTALLVMLALGMAPMRGSAQDAPPKPYQRPWQRVCLAGTDIVWGRDNVLIRCPANVEPSTAACVPFVAESPTK